MLLGIVSLAAVLAAPLQVVGRESYTVYLCPMHRDEQATGAGTCPVCARELVERVLVPSYSCPMHQQVDEELEGTCPICKMKLVPTTRELQWYCPDRPEILAALPGTCPDGTAMAMRSLPMAHGDHNPKHGGVLFMAPNGYHHLEGTLQQDGTFRLYLYDDFTRPIDPSDIQARSETTALAATGEGTLEARLSPPSSYPAEVVVHVRFPGEEGKEARFDFVFAGKAGAVAVALPEFRIPESTEEIYAEIGKRNERLLELIRAGSWADLYIPALEAKDLVLALNAQTGERIALPAKTLVRAAWLLDLYGDRGNRLEVERAYRLFEEGMSALEEAYEP
jgi:hypothetical protein